jgi:uncharacterized protein (DUF1330 family)
MAVEILVGLNVVDDVVYQSYRDEMAPILDAYGGGFGYDFRIAEVLRSQTEAPINRVFTIFFRDTDAKSSFFANADYVKIKQNYFDASVTATTVLAEYET